ncbi:MAG: single-stranded-DNA-specific exonuclease RecJ [Campylobacterales bacterium]|nr:single-stranded-DNA-specific exonuclease RecJ [Campylobacterales bacterium]HEO97998.1 single-stranded-DNA-specific exonuclease RecJ [Campylobacterota bacterium]
MGIEYPKITLEGLERLLNERFNEGFLTLRDLPPPSAFKDMDKATDRIVKAIQNREKITVIGDYDVDGVVSTTLMVRFFEEIDYPIEWIIPNRFKDGYGLSSQLIPRIVGSDLAITVDNGISAIEAAKHCKEEGIDLIITDHHIPGEILPEAYAIVNQKQDACTFPYHEVCGAQIAWYLIASLKNALDIKIDMVSYLELAAVAIIADVMPLQHINRAMVKRGLEAFSKSDLPAIRAFLELHQKSECSSEDIAFFLAPLLNSAGRMEDAMHAVEFLSSKNIYDARVRLERLQGFNALRKETEEQITQKALNQVDPNDHVIVVRGEEWHEGVVGIVAARVARVHQKPAIVLSHNGKGILKGSGRSVESCDLFEITDACRGYLEKFGGHSAAIGLSLSEENLTPFKNALQEEYEKRDYRPQRTDPELLGILDFSLVSFDLTGLIKRFEPFGEKNTKPKFITRNVRIMESAAMGKDHNHLRFTFEHNGSFLKGVKFKTTERFEADTLVDITYFVNENYFNGKSSLQLLIDNIVKL